MADKVRKGGKKSKRPKRSPSRLKRRSRVKHLAIRETGTGGLVMRERRKRRLEPGCYVPMPYGSVGPIRPPAQGWA